MECRYLAVFLILQFWKLNSSLINILFANNVLQRWRSLAVKISHCASLSASPSAQCLNCFDRKVKGECNYVSLEELRWAHQEIIGRVPVEAASLWDSGPFKITQVTWGHAWWLKICGATNMGHQRGNWDVGFTNYRKWFFLIFFMALKSKRGGFIVLYTWEYMWQSCCRHTNLCWICSSFIFTTG